MKRREHAPASREGTGEGRMLWRRFATPSDDGGQTSAPDPVTLAAWLEGRLVESEAGKVEAWLAADPDALDEIGAWRAGISDPPREAPPELVAAARALVAAPPRRAWKPGALAWLRAPAFAAAVAAIAAVSGFLMGAATFGEIEATEARIAAALWAEGERFGQDG